MVQNCWRVRVLRYQRHASPWPAPPNQRYPTAQAYLHALHLQQLCHLSH